MTNCADWLLAKWPTKRPGILAGDALVHEAWLRLAGSQQQTWRTALISSEPPPRQSRRSSVDHARVNKALKRGGGADPEQLNESFPGSRRATDELLAVHEALSQLALETTPPRSWSSCAISVGMTMEEAASAMGLGEAHR